MGILDDESDEAGGEAGDDNGGQNVQMVLFGVDQQRMGYRET